MAGLVAGGFLAQHTTRPAGVVLSGLMHVADFLATICSASGIVAPKDMSNTVPADLPALDSISMWDYWIGLQPHSPRTELQISAQTLLRWVDANKSNNSVNRLLKLMVGDVPYACWSGTDYPTGGTGDHCSTTVHCGTEGCLYDVLADVSERHTIDIFPTKAEMVARLSKLNSARFEPDRGVPDPAACVAADRYGGVAGPWLGVTLPPYPSPGPLPPTPRRRTWGAGIPGKYFAQCPDLQNLVHETVALCEAACDAHPRCNAININTQESGPNAAKCALRSCPCGIKLSPSGISPNVTAYRRNDHPCPCAP